MRVIVVGNGGREQALSWKISQSPLVEGVYSEQGSDIDGIVSRALEDRADLVVIGPEAPLVAGLADKLEAVGIPAFGPSAAAAQLEGSKIFMKRLCDQEGIPTAPWYEATTYEDARDLIFSQQDSPVIKADGLCGGKGVVVSHNHQEAAFAALAMMLENRFGTAGSRIVIEEKLLGTEVSFMCLCCGEVAIPLKPARDYKRAYDGDEGPNTGGMGSYAPVSDMTDALVEVVMARIILPTLRAMKARGTPFRGVLYAGLMLTADGPKLLEYNVRFGDPEIQALLALLLSDIVPYFDAIARNEPEELVGLGPLEFSENVAVCQVLSVEGYPEHPKIGGVVDDLGDLPDTLFFRAGMKLAESGLWHVSSGRVANAVGVGPDFSTARQRARARSARVMYPFKYERSDIARHV